MDKIDSLGSSFETRVKMYARCCERIEELLSKDTIAITDAELIYESTYIAVVGLFEGTLGQLLEEFVCGAHAGAKGRRRIVEPESRKVFHTLLTGGRAYADFLPYQTGVEHAKRFLYKGRPYTETKEQDKAFLAEIIKVRNAIAHRSDIAMEKFRRQVTGVLNLSPRKRFPGPYLRSTFRTMPDQRYYELHFATMRKVVRDLILDWKNG